MDTDVQEASTGPTNPGRLYPVARALLKPSSKFVWPTEIVGLENIPDDGPAIIAPNHISFLDSALLMGILPRKVMFVGKAEYLDNWKTKHLFPACGMIPIDRSGGKSSTRALDAAAAVLDAGGLFGIYPEGTRSRDGILRKGRTGVARLSLRTGAPIIPVGIRGTDKIQPPDARFPVPFRRCQFHFGSPIYPGRFAARAADARVYREMTDEVMFEISELSGQRYVHEYAGKSTATVAPETTSSELIKAASTS